MRVDRAQPGGVGSGEGPPAGGACDLRELLRAGGTGTVTVVRAALDRDRAVRGAERDRVDRDVLRGRLARGRERADADVRGAVGDQHDRARRALAGRPADRLFELAQRGLDRLADRGAAAGTGSWPSAASRERVVGGRRLEHGRRAGELEQPDLDRARARRRGNRAAACSCRARAARGRRRWPASSSLTSLASMIAPLVTGTATLRCGRAAATISTASASSEREHRQVTAPARAPRRDRRRQRRGDERRRRPRRAGAAGARTSRSSSGIASSASRTSGARSSWEPAGRAASVASRRVRRSGPADTGSAPGRRRAGPRAPRRHRRACLIGRLPICGDHVSGLEARSSCGAAGDDVGDHPPPTPGKLVPANGATVSSPSHPGDALEAAAGPAVPDPLTTKTAPNATAALSSATNAIRNARRLGRLPPTGGRRGVRGSWLRAGRGGGAGGRCAGTRGSGRSASGASGGSGRLRRRASSSARLAESRSQSPDHRCLGLPIVAGS